MTAISGLTGDRLYLDTNIFIYSVEGHATHAAILRKLFEAIVDQTVVAVTSELTLAEALVKPLQRSRGHIAAVYENLLSGTGPIQLAAVDRSVPLQSAAIRASDGGRLFDAIHVATAIQQNCDFFLTEDNRVRTPSTLPVLRLSELTDKP